MRKLSPLALDFTPQGRAQVAGAVTWLKGFSPSAAQRFASKLTTETASLCKEYARIPPPHPMNDEASVHFARPIFRHRFQTGKAIRKRSASGVWYVFFELRDLDGDGLPDQLRVVSLLHASAAPLGEEPRDEGEPGDDKGESDA